MQAGTAYMKHHNQVVRIVYWNICADLEVPKSKWEIPAKVVKNDRAPVDFQIQTDKTGDG